MKKKLNDLNYFVAEPFESFSPYSLIQSNSDLDLQDKWAIDNLPSVNFVLNDYLAFSSDERVKHTAVKSVGNDRGLLVSDGLLYQKTEEYLSWIFDKPVLFFPNSGMIHTEVMPHIINSNDIVLYDRFVHSNLQIAINLLQHNGNHVETLQHNSVQLIEEKLNGLKDKRSRVWYLADSIYSMLGDVFPVTEIQRLLKTYDQFYVYIDDSKGMSWTGKNGRGYVYNYFHDYPKVVLTSSLSKGFGSNGGVLVCYNEKMKEQLMKSDKLFTCKSIVKPSTLRSVIESAKIHLSSEIYFKQSELQAKVELFHATAKGLGLPLVSSPHTPSAFFITGTPDISQEICFHLMKKGYYLNVANYPAVPIGNSGIMANITLLQTDNNIRKMLKIFKDEYVSALLKRKLPFDYILKNYETNKQLV
jgi:7-keto-8-aminopelargonate synthetase-like enzyme